jgi:hypothetical protein
MTKKENAQDIINAFFKQENDGNILADGIHVRHSVLLALINDIKFCSIFPPKYREIFQDIPYEQQSFIISQLEYFQPSFTIAQLICTSIDVLSRVNQKRETKLGENKKFFISYIKEQLSFDEKNSSALWKFRNGIIHQYKIIPGKRLETSGNQFFEYNEEEDRYILRIRPAILVIERKSEELYSRFSKAEENEKDEVSKYLRENGFFYTGI